MPAPRFRSRTYRRIRKTLPGGKSVIQHEKRAPSPAICATCGKELMGVPRQRPIRMRKLSISKKRPERAYGGYLCSDCSREQIKKEART